MVDSISMLMEDVDAQVKVICRAADELCRPRDVAQSNGVDAGVTGSFKRAQDDFGLAMETQIILIARKLEAKVEALRGSIADARKTEQAISESIATILVDQLEGGHEALTPLVDEPAVVPSRPAIEDFEDSGGTGGGDGSGGGSSRPPIEDFESPGGAGSSGGGGRG